MPIYQVFCENCGHREDVFFGKIVSEGFVDEPCRKCGNQGLRKIPMPINNAGFSSAGSRRSMKTKTGVGELIMKRGSKKVLDEADK